MKADLFDTNCVTIPKYKYIKYWDHCHLIDNAKKNQNYECALACKDSNFKQKLFCSNSNIMIKSNKVY